MTPVEIFEYKMRWMKETPHSVRLHSDLDTQGKSWCRRHLERHQWVMHSWTNNYEHTFHFEQEESAKLFEQQWTDYINKE